MKPLSVFVVLTIVVAASSARALDSGLPPEMDKERKAAVAQWKAALASDDPAQIDKALAAAKAKANVAFGMSDWPMAVAETAAKAKPELQAVLLDHLREHRKLLSQATADAIKALFKRDVLDPRGEQVRAWVAAGDKGSKDAAAQLKAAADAKRPEDVVEILDAISRCGNDRLLGAAATCLNSDNAAVSQAALSVFKAHAKDYGPDLRSPRLCQLWWIQSGKMLVGDK